MSFTGIRIKVFFAGLLMCFMLPSAWADWAYEQKDSYFNACGNFQEDAIYARNLADATVSVAKRLLPLPSQFDSLIVVEAANEFEKSPYAEVSVVNGKEIQIRANFIRDINFYSLCYVYADAMLSRLAVFNDVPAGQASAKIPFWLTLAVAREIELAAYPFVMDGIVSDAVPATAFSAREMESLKQADDEFINYSLLFFRGLQDSYSRDRVQLQFLVRDFILGKGLRESIESSFDAKFESERDFEIWKALLVRKMIQVNKLTLPVLSIAETVEQLNAMQQFVLFVDTEDKQLSLRELGLYSDVYAVKNLAKQRSMEAKFFFESKANPLCANVAMSLALALECIAEDKMKNFDRCVDFFYSDVAYATALVSRVYRIKELKETGRLDEIQTESE